ncbi:MAG: hypothetical protein K8T91_02435 [Planctomycetes bacterium]|nr:hypothetical protein [Planctomycetota bacterium]
MVTLAELNDEWLDVLKSLPKLKTLDIVDVHPKPNHEKIAKLSKRKPSTMKV